MFRFGVVSALATAVTADSVLDGALAWIKANGEEVLDTTQHCVAAAKIASGLHSKCGQVFNPEGWAAFAAWGLLESLEYVDYPLASQLKNSSFIESAKEQTIKAFEATNHENLEKFCGQPDCVKGVETMEKEYGSCYGGTLCASMSQNFDYAKCKAAMEDNLPKSFRSQEHSACAKDGDFYCAQQLATLLMQNSKCYVKFFLPATPGTPDACPSECVNLWKKEQGEHPVCMTLLEGQLKGKYEISQNLTKQLILSNKDPKVRAMADQMPTTMHTFTEVCIHSQALLV